MLDAAFDSGVTHFDVAPMYGMGRAESELAPLLARRRDEVTVTTKFGICPTSFGRMAGATQRPIRSVLARRPRTEAGLKSVGSGPRSGRMGRLLYLSEGYSVESARTSLARSLRSLGTDYIDVFALHDPVGALLEGDGLAEFLESECRRGTIRTWGLAGELVDTGGTMADLIRRAPVLQFHDDIFCEPQRFADFHSGKMTFGALGRVLPILTRYMSRHPEERYVWSDHLGFDVVMPGVLPMLLLRESLRRNSAGPVIFSTSQPARAYAIAEAMTTIDEMTNPGESIALRRLAARIAETDLLEVGGA